MIRREEETNRKIYIYVYDCYFILNFLILKLTFYGMCHLHYCLAYWSYQWLNKNVFCKHWNWTKQCQIVCRTNCLLLATKLNGNASHLHMQNIGCVMELFCCCSTCRYCLDSRPDERLVLFLLACLLTHSLTHLLIHSLAHSLTRSLSHSLTHSLRHLLTYLLTHSLTHSLARSLARSLTHSLTY